MASIYQWADLALKNSKVIVTMYILLCGFAGYTIYDFVGIDNPQQAPKVESLPQYPAMLEPKIITETRVVEKILQPIVNCNNEAVQAHVKEFH
jgi:hypothetical protein